MSTTEIVRCSTPTRQRQSVASGWAPPVQAPFATLSAGAAWTAPTRRQDGSRRRAGDWLGEGTKWNTCGTLWNTCGTVCGTVRMQGNKDL